MKELTIVIDHYQLSYDELKNYLLSLEGILEVNIIDVDDLLRLNIKYDDKLISLNIIKYEILAFLNLLKTPCIYEFDKHLKENTKICKVERDNICCEYCYAGCIEDLFDMEGVIKISSNFHDKHFKRRHDKDKYEIIIHYNDNLVDINNIKNLINDIDN